MFVEAEEDVHDEFTITGFGQYIKAVLHDRPKTHRVLDHSIAISKGAQKCLVYP